MSLPKSESRQWRGKGSSGYLWALFVLAVSLNTAIAAGQYTLDAAHSQLTFRVRQYVSTVIGKFKEFSGTVTFDSAQPERSRVEATISVRSIDTGIEARDHHLLAADFFDAQKYPTITFKSSSVQWTGGRVADVRGDLTMHGQTRPVSIHVELLTSGKGDNALSWSVTAHLKRSEFGLQWSPLIEATSGISDEIEIRMTMVTPAR